ncbi:dihydrofolate reductase family protein [Microbacterium sp. CJ88]|uniref:dihydrofolate reductase family protein n=1 Tax=Microbacterium sp. CJ88 TaxID=3445672 RepID=UPI003F65AB7B
MRTLIYAINVTVDGCVDHRTGFASDALHDFWADRLTSADALLYGRVTFEMMRAAWAGPAGEAMPDEASRGFARTIDRARKHVVSRTLTEVDWNAELLDGDLGDAVRELKARPGGDILTGGVMLPTALAALGLIDVFEFVVHPQVAGHGPALLAGLPGPIDLTLVAREDVGSEAVLTRYMPTR